MFGEHRKNLDPPVRHGGGSSIVLSLFLLHVGQVSLSSLMELLNFFNYAVNS